MQVYYQKFCHAYLIGSFVAVVSLSATSWAYKVTVENESSDYIFLYVQSIGGGEASDTAERIFPGKSRVYETGNPFLSYPTMDVEEGDVRTASIFNQSRNKFAKCGSITFTGATHLIYKDGVCTSKSFYYWLLMFAHAL